MDTTEQAAPRATCPPCTGNCNQGRTCPANCTGGCEGGTRDCDCGAAIVGRVIEPPARWKRLTTSLILVVGLVAAAYIVVSLGEMGWRMVP